MLSVRSRNNNSIGGLAKSNAAFAKKGYLNIVRTGSSAVFDLNAHLEDLGVNVGNVSGHKCSQVIGVKALSEHTGDEPFALVSKLKLVIHSYHETKRSHFVKTFALNSKDNGFASFGFGLVGNNGYFTVGSKCGNAQSENHQSHQDY